MLIEFRFKNYRSFRDEAIMSMEAMGLGSKKDCLIHYKSQKILPTVAIYGKNGGGKGNVIRAFWLAVQFIKNAQRTQHEKSEIPVHSFALNDYSAEQPTEFEFIYTKNSIKYWYGFSATRQKILEEHLFHAPKGQRATVFHREGQNFSFTEDKALRKLIGKMVSENQLFFSVACTMNDADCVKAMQWFREDVRFSRDYADIPDQLINYTDDPLMLKAISNYAKAADLGIEDVQFDVNNQEIDSSDKFPENMPDELKRALSQFAQALASSPHVKMQQMRVDQVDAKTTHKGKNKDGSKGLYKLDLDDESDGTRRLMSIAPGIESALRTGGLLLIDEINRELHPILVAYIVAKFQNKSTNPNGAQLVFTTHNTELMGMDLLRKDQFYFVDKRNADGVSELYSVSELGTRTTENIQKNYILGKYGAIPNVEIEEVE